MTAKVRIEVDARTAKLLEARAAAHGVSVPELIADLASNEEALPAGLPTMRAAGEGPGSPATLEEDARRLADFERSREGVPWNEVKAWMQSWGTANELPPPKPRRL